MCRRMCVCVGGSVSYQKLEKFILIGFNDAYARP